MKTHVIALFFCLMLQRELLSATGLSNTNGGVYLAIGGCCGGTGNVSDEPIQVNDRLLWMPFCDHAEVELSYPDSTYGVKIQMWGKDGHQVPKTALSKSFGTKWNELRSYKDTRVYPILAAGAYTANPGLGGAHFLPSPAQLFQVEKPGTYTLEIQMQMFRHSASLDPAVWQTNLIQFSMIRIKVEKPVEDKK